MRSFMLNFHSNLVLSCNFLRVSAPIAVWRKRCSSKCDLLGVGGGSMRVHPVPAKRNVNAIRSPPVLGRQKKLRRLPHIFSKVLELPLRADADVTVEEGFGAFRFSAATDNLWDDVRAHAIQIYPGVMKVVIRDGRYDAHNLEEELELDRWRFRLPPSTRPALASATYVNGELVVIIPKAAEAEEDEDDNEEEDSFYGNDGHGSLKNGDFGRLIVVQ